jgi:hypothetical protein
VHGENKVGMSPLRYMPGGGTPARKLLQAWAIALAVGEHSRRASRSASCRPLSHRPRKSRWRVKCTLPCLAQCSQSADSPRVISWLRRPAAAVSWWRVLPEDRGPPAQELPSVVGLRSRPHRDQRACTDPKPPLAESAGCAGSRHSGSPRPCPQFRGWSGRAFR